MPHQNFINGQWRDALDGATDPVLAPATGLRVATDIVIVPVLRAGLGMLEAALEIAPTARVGYIDGQYVLKIGRAHV